MTCRRPIYRPLYIKPVGVFFFDEHNPKEAAVVAVYTWRLSFKPSTLGYCDEESAWCG